MKPVPPRARALPVPCVRQRTDHTCGAAAVLAVATYFGVGPRTERAVVRDMRFGRDGSDPVHLVRALDRYRLATTERRGMTDAELRAWLDRRCPVIVMLQAWGDRRAYRHHWTDGHWVVAIGHDRRGVYFVDPMLEDAHGVLTWRELDERWHDVEGPTRRHVYRYALAIDGGRSRSRSPEHVHAMTRIR